MSEKMTLANKLRELAKVIRQHGTCAPMALEYIALELDAKDDAHLAAVPDNDTASFKNFHRSLCDRFGYTHDEVDWRRDLVSLEEHIAIRLSQGDEAQGEELGWAFQHDETGLMTVCINDGINTRESFSALNPRHSFVADVYTHRTTATVPNALDLVKTPYSDIPCSIAYRLGWNSCREAMLTQRGNAQDAVALCIGQRVMWEDNLGRSHPATIVDSHPETYDARLDDGTYANGYSRKRFAIDAHLATLPAASTSPDGGEAVDNATKWLIDCARRSIPFLMDEASKYDDDGSNEPLETARDIDKAIDELAAAYQAGLDQEDQARKTYAFDVLINIGHVTRHEAEAALAIAKRSLSAQRGEAES